MRLLTISKAAEVCRGKLTGTSINGEAALGKAVIDSRIVEKGDFFVAFKGEKVDGHDYISSALDNGAVCCLAERAPEGETRPVILVDDVQRAFEEITAYYRSLFDIPVIGITGSVGKTSAKEMISSVLAQRFSVMKTDGNLNNQIGVPMTLSTLEKEHDIAVVELGVSHFGDMKQIACIAKPTIAVFTVIGHAHLEFLRDMQGVFDEKTSMIDFMNDDGLVIYNGDDQMLIKLSCRQRKISYGIKNTCDVKAENIVSRADGTTSCDIKFEGRKLSVIIPAFGAHLVYAALEAAAVGFALELSDEEIIQGICEYKTVGRRGAVIKSELFTLIDDCYNSNPDSARSAIDSLVKLNGRHICVFGDMLELGYDSYQMHYEVGKYALDSGVDAMFTYGAMSKAVSESAGSITAHFDDKNELIKAVKNFIKKGDIVLVKASQGMGFYQISEALKAME